MVYAVLGHFEGSFGDFRIWDDVVAHPEFDRGSICPLNGMWNLESSRGIPTPSGGVSDGPSVFSPGDRKAGMPQKHVLRHHLATFPLWVV